jgi:hypothetical protein
MVSRILSKSKFSMYLRTQCDKELYLSLFKDKNECLAAGIPVPLKSRPGVQIITKSGREFEFEQYDQLIRAIPNNVLHESNGKAPTNLIQALNRATDSCFILQPAIEPENFRETALGNIDLDASEKSLIPPLAGLKPDALFIHTKMPDEFEILPNGSRKVLSRDDNRLGISVIDLKNVTEGNPSYSGEVCLYAFFLANWLATDGAALKDKFYVSDKVYLWMHTEMPEFNRVLGLSTGSDARGRIKALLKDLEDGLVDYLIYMPSVRKFLKEDVPRVVRKGDAEGWASVEYHVNQRCGSCDFLGHTDWLNPDDKAIYDRNPTHYCIASAEGIDHLCKLPNLSKGATQILFKGGHSTVSNLVGIPITDPILKKHAFLKREKLHIGHKATAITTGVSSVDNHNKIAGLARSLNAEYDIIVNFDAGSGLFTGLSMRGILFPPFGKEIAQQNGTPKKSHSHGEVVFVVPKDTANAEWAVLQAFIEKLSQWILDAEKIFFDNGNANGESWGSVHTQICFWEQRQYEELCNAFGRHLLRILNLSERSQKALAWLFPAEELIEREEQLAPGIIFIRDIVDLALRLPVKFVNTLLGVAEFYHLQAMPPRRIDRYYKELLGNAIPRERIFEIWKSTTGTVRMYGRDITTTEAIQKYGDVLKAHTWALASITAKLRTDLRTSLQGTAPALNLSMLSGAASVAYDSKLWIQWERVNSATADTESKASLITSVERLESSYKVILLTRLVRGLGNNRYEFEVSEDSTESKLEEGRGYYVLGIQSIPGYPLLTGIKLGLAPPTPADTGNYRTPLHRVIAVTLMQFDRANKKAVIELRPARRYLTSLFDALMAGGHIPILNQSIYLLEGPSPSFLDHTIRVLRRIGNPSFATPAREAVSAMGMSASRRITPGTDPSTPTAQILWQANNLAKAIVRSITEAQAIANYAETANVYSLNSSQKNAVLACSKNQLSVIWGPPGTGKTDTLVALVHSIVHEAQTNNRSRKILITGPNYRAVEELVFRLIDNLNRDTTCASDLFMVYSRSRDPKALPVIAPHLNAFSFRLDSFDPQCTALSQSIGDSNKVTIVGTTVHQVIKITDFIFGADTDPVRELFDFIVIDESSQVEIVRAIQPMAVLKIAGQIVVAGDHLQMPPISQIEPPTNAEYLVGSIQTYLIERFGIQTQNLVINYRSNQDLVEYAKSIGYPQGLTANHRTKQLKEITTLDSVIATLPTDLPQSRAYSELLLPNRMVTTLIHDDVVSSQANEIEAKLVAGLAYCLRHSMASTLDMGNAAASYSGFTDDEFFTLGLGVVTPHKAQKALVIKELKALFPVANRELIYDAVDTVERFQGSQRQTIIISFGVGDIDIIEGEEVFLLQKERTNVAVSRAEGKCILIMPKSLAYHLPSDQEAAKTSRAIKSYVEEFCGNRIALEIENDGTIHSAEVRWH